LNLQCLIIRLRLTRQINLGSQGELEQIDNFNIRAEINIEETTGVSAQSPNENTVQKQQVSDLNLPIHSLKLQKGFFIDKRGSF